MPEVRVLVEVIAGPKVLATVDSSAAIEDTAVILSELIERPLVTDEGKPISWKLYAPGKGGAIAPLKPGSTLEQAHNWADTVTETGKKGGFAGPGEHEGDPYLFRVRFFVPKPRKPRPPAAKPPPILDEEALDLTDIDAEENTLETVRRRALAETEKKRKRKRKKRAAAETPEEASDLSTMKRRKRRKKSGAASATGPIKKKRRKKRRTGEMPAIADPAATSEQEAAPEAPATAAPTPAAEAPAPAQATTPSPAPEPPQTPPAPEAATPAPTPAAPAPAPAPATAAPAPTPAAARPAPAPPPRPAPAPAPKPATAPKPAAEKAAAPKPAVEKPAAEKAAAPKPAPEKPAAEKPAAEKAAATKPAPEKPAATKPAPEKPAAAAPEPKAPEPPPAAPKAADTKPADEEDSTRRVVAAAPLKAKAPEPGQAPVTGQSKTVPKESEKPAATKEGPPAAQAEPAPVAKPKKKNGSNAALFGALGVLGLVLAAMAYVVMNRGGDEPTALPASTTEAQPAPAPAPASAPAPATAARLSEDLRLGDVGLGEGAPGDAVVTAVGEFKALGITTPSDAADPAVRDKASAIAGTLESACRAGGRFDACHVWSRAAYAVYAGCQGGTCDGKTSGDWFLKSVEGADLALTQATQLTDPIARTKATRLLVTQSIRLGSANQKTVTARAPRIGALGAKSCGGAMASTPDCQALVRSQ